jgi:cbb3-type cytochrome oxidase subunit 3
MNKKIIFQIFLFFLIFFFIGLLAFQYSLNEKAKDASFSENNIDLNSNTNTSSNTMSNIEYKSTDTIGNQYLIRAKLGSISDEDANLIFMQDVEAEIQFDNNEKILISASSAEYNIVNYDTFFRDQTNIKYNEHNLNCDNADLIFKDHKIKLYSNINYSSLNTYLLADEIEIDLISKNIKIYMIDKNQKIKATFKNNVSN